MPRRSLQIYLSSIAMSKKCWGRGCVFQSWTSKEHHLAQESDSFASKEKERVLQRSRPDMDHKPMHSAHFRVMARLTRLRRNFGGSCPSARRAHQPRANRTMVLTVVLLSKFSSTEKCICSLDLSGCAATCSLPKLLGPVPV